VNGSFSGKIQKSDGAEIPFDRYRLFLSYIPSLVGSTVERANDLAWDLGGIMAFMKVNLLVLL
jgi:hypothetical protein